MAYASTEDARAYSREHYARNKAAHNPGRHLVRSMTKEARRRVAAASMDQWVGPKQMQAICMRVPMYWRLETDLMRSNVYKGCAQGFPGSEDGGVFLGRSPFMPALKFGPKDAPSIKDEWCRRKFLKLLRYVRSADCSAELLILKVTIEGEMTYGR